MDNFIKGVLSIIAIVMIIISFQLSQTNVVTKKYADYEETKEAFDKILNLITKSQEITKVNIEDINFLNKLAKKYEIDFKENERRFHFLACGTLKVEQIFNRGTGRDEQCHYLLSK
tara:strand:- start:156 stop:503 length:348 start_codon:yes stop_codon:yes gene_type:complete